MFCRGVEGEVDEAEVDDSVVHPIELDYEKDGTNDDDDDDEKDTARYTNSERASLQIIDEAKVGADDDDEKDDNVIGANDDDDNDDHNKIYNDNAETEEKDEAFYQREE